MATIGSPVETRTILPNGLRAAAPMTLRGCGRLSLIAHKRSTSESSPFRCGGYRYPYLGSRRETSSHLPTFPGIRQIDGNLDSHRRHNVLDLSLYVIILDKRGRYSAR